MMQSWNYFAADTSFPINVEGQKSPSNHEDINANFLIKYFRIKVSAHFYWFNAIISYFFPWA